MFGQLDGGVSVPRGATVLTRPGRREGVNCSTQVKRRDEEGLGLEMKERNTTVDWRDEDDDKDDNEGAERE